MDLVSHFMPLPSKSPLMPPISKSIPSKMAPEANVPLQQAALMAVSNMTNISFQEQDLYSVMGVSSRINHSPYNCLWAAI